MEGTWREGHGKNVLCLENTSKLPASVQNVSSSTVHLYYSQAMLKKKSIMLNTSKQFQSALRKPKADVTDTWNQIFQFVFFPLANNQDCSHIFESLYLGIISIW